MRISTSVIPIICLLSACGGSGGSSTSPTTTVPPTSNTTAFSLAVSDAPVDDATAVVVVFDSVELIGNGEPLQFSVRDENDQPMQVDLLALQGSLFTNIVENVEIPTGDYSQIRINVLEDSYIEMMAGTFPLEVPSGELKLDGFSAQANTTAAYTVEFDLRKSLVDPKGKPVIYLKPRGVRLVANETVGSIEGTVASSLVMNEQCADKIDPDAGNAVYLYQGTIEDLSLLGDDADTPANPEEIAPFTTASVNFDESTQSYTYAIGFVEEGDYTLAFTCHAQVDLPESDENAEDGFDFLQLQAVSVMAGQTTEANME